jgi:hypothetical protein
LLKVENLHAGDVMLPCRGELKTESPFGSIKAIDQGFSRSSAVSSWSLEDDDRRLQRVNVVGKLCNGHRHRHDHSIFAASFPSFSKAWFKMPQVFLDHRLRPLYSHRSDLLPVQPIDQRKQLRMVQLQRGRPGAQQNCASSSNQTALIRSALFERNT